MPLHWLLRMARWVRHPPSAGRVRLVLIVLAAKPYRATYRDMTHFMPGPTRSSLHNSLNSFAFYAVNLAGREQQALPVSPFQPYQVPGGRMMMPGTYTSPGSVFFNPLLTAAVVTGIVGVIVVATDDDDDSPSAASSVPASP